MKLLFLSIILCCGSAVFSAEERVGALVKLKNSVEYQLQNEKTWEAAGRGQLLNKGTRLKTGPSGLAMVKLLEDNSYIRMKPRSLLELPGERQKPKLRLNIGTVLFKIRKRTGSGQFSVETPTSVATIKGTAFWMTVDDKGNTLLVVDEGAVLFKDRKTGKAIRVETGQTAVNDEDGLRVRETREDDLPKAEQNRELIVPFRDNQGKIRKLEIEFDKP